MANHLHEGDLPDGAFAGATSVAIDSETMGLVLGRDPLCVAQLSAGDGEAHVVRFSRPSYGAPNLERLLADPGVLKIFHFGRFDIAMFLLHLNVLTRPVYCTKIASRLARTYTDRHGLKEKLDEMLAREGRAHLAKACFEFLPHRAALDVAGWPDVDIFAHS